MRKLINSIKKKNLSIEQLTFYAETKFKESHKIRMWLIPDLNEKYCRISERHKELFEMGESSPEYRCHFELHTTLDWFKKGIKGDNWYGNEKEFQKYLLGKADKMFWMLTLMYEYRAYKTVLKNKLDMMDYNYTREEKDWI